MKYFGYPLTNKFRAMTPEGFYDKVKGHTGIDVVMPIGTPLSLPIRGVALKYRKQTEMGWVLYVQEPNGNIHVLAHLSEAKVKEGDSVSKGQALALSGNSGSRTTAPHVHYEIISQHPHAELEMMTRELKPYKGWNIPPEEYLKNAMRAPRLKPTARSRESSASLRKYKGTPQGDSMVKARNRASKAFKALKSFFNL